MRKYDRKAQRAVAQDWHALFAGLVVVEPRTLGRLTGPFFTGIELDRVRGESYRPYPFIHNLGRHSDVLTLALTSPAPNVEMRGHEQGEWRKHADAIASEFRVLKSELVSIGDLVKLHASAWRRRAAGQFHAGVSVLQSLACLWAWLGEDEFVREISRFVDSGLSSHPTPERIPGFAHIYAGELRALAETPSVIRAQVEAEVDFHGLTGLPRVELSVDEGPKPIW